MKSVDKLKADLERVKNKIATLKGMKAGKEIFESEIYLSLKNELKEADRDSEESIKASLQVFELGVGKPYIKKEKITDEQRNLSGKRFDILSRYLNSMRNKEIDYLLKLKSGGKISRRQLESRIDKLFHS